MLRGFEAMGGLGLINRVHVSVSGRPERYGGVEMNCGTISRRTMVLALAALVACACMLALLPQSASAAELKAAEATALEPATNTSPGLTRLYMGRTYTSYDITGDGKADTIECSWIGKVKPSKESSYTYNAGLVLRVNGAQALTIGKDKFKSQSDGYQLSLITLQNGRKYLYVSGEYVNLLDYVDNVYEYRNGSLKVAFNLFKLMDSKAKKAYASYGLRSPRVSGVSGNTIQLTCTMTQCMIGVAHFKTGLKYKGGKLVVSPKTAKLDMVYSTTSVHSLKALKSIQVYKKKTGSKKAFKIKKGQKVVPKKLFLKNRSARILVKVGKRTGWIKFNKAGMKVSYYAKNGAYGWKNKYFDNICAVA